LRPNQSSRGSEDSRTSPCFSPLAGSENSCTGDKEPAAGASLPASSGRLLTCDQLATFPGVSVGWVRKGVLDRTLPYTKIGRNVRFTPAQVEQILRDGDRPALHANIPRHPGSARTRL
jgi:hypothetical protein